MAATTPSADAASVTSTPASSTPSRLTCTAPPGKCSSTARAASCARRVLPTPPAPTSVTSLTSSRTSSAAISVSSPARPIVALGGDGSVVTARAPSGACAGCKLGRLAEASHPGRAEQRYDDLRAHRAGPAPTLTAAARARASSPGRPAGPPGPCSGGAAADRRYRCHQVSIGRQRRLGRHDASPRHAAESAIPHPFRIGRAPIHRAGGRSTGLSRHFADRAAVRSEDACLGLRWRRKRPLCRPF